MHRKIEHNEVFRAQELDSYAQGQCHNQVRGQTVPKIVLLMNYWGKFDKTSQKDKTWWEGVPTSNVKVVIRSKVTVVSQQYLKYYWSKFNETSQKDRT